jgi:Fe-S-cluster containining protein
MSMARPEPSKAIAAYAALLRKLAGIEKRLYGKYLHAIECRKGCSDCCVLGGVFAVEAEGMRRAVSRLKPGIKKMLSDRIARRRGDRCILLYQDSCLIYKARPVICRTHGYPLLVNGKLAFCDRNFRGIKAMDSGCVTDLDRLNLALAAINIAFMRDTKERKTRVKLRDMVREALRG